MQLEAVESVHAALPSLCHAGKHLMAVDAAVMTNGQGQAVEEGNTARVAQTGPQIGRQRHQHRRQALNQALIADQMGKLGPPVTAHLFAVEMLEGAVIRVLKRYDQRHDFAHAQMTGPTTMPTRSGQKMLVPSRSKGLIEVVEIAIQGYNIHGKALKQNWFANHRVDRSTCSCKGPCLNRTDVILLC